MKVVNSFTLNHILSVHSMRRGGVTCDARVPFCSVVHQPFLGQE